MKFFSLDLLAIENDEVDNGGIICCAGFDINDSGSADTIS